VTTRTAVAVNATADAADPSREDTYDFELKAGSTIIESGSVGSDSYTGHLCLF
jgi:predicted oxidoreductase